MWRIPKVDAAFVASKEDILDLDDATPDPRHPVVCFGASPRQLIGESLNPIRPRL